jgi:hypothetical protein
MEWFYYNVSGMVLLQCFWNGSTAMFLEWFYYNVSGTETLQ